MDGYDRELITIETNRESESTTYIRWCTVGILVGLMVTLIYFTYEMGVILNDIKNTVRDINQNTYEMCMLEIQTTGINQSLCYYNF